MTTNATNVDAYISNAPLNRQPALHKIRELLKSCLPNHLEDMAYKMPSYKRNGQVEVAFASQKQHLCIYFLIHSVMLENKSHLAKINHGKGCIRFSNPDKVNYDLIALLAQQTQLKNNESIC